MKKGISSYYKYLCCAHVCRDVRGHSEERGVQRVPAAEFRDIIYCPLGLKPGIHQGLPLDFKE